MKIRFLALLSIIAVIAMNAASVSASRSYNDLSDSHKYYQAITFITDEGIVNGYDDGTYKPETNLNRAELLKILVEANATDAAIEAYSNDNCFDDVPANAWYTKYVCYAKDHGVVEGYAGNLFKPSRTISFVEALKISMEIFDYDYNNTDIWYEGIVDAASAKNFIPLDVSSFDQNFNRGQMADLVTRTLKYRDSNLDTYLGEHADLIVSYETISQGQYLDPVALIPVPTTPATTPSWAWKKATTVDDAHNFINGLGAYSEPHAVQSIAAKDDGFYIFYRDDLEGANEWGWKLSETPEDAYHFLNRTGSYSGEPKDKAELAYSNGDLYVFYSGTDSSADWGWKRSTGIDDMFNYINGAGSYDESVFGTMGGDTLSDILMFHRDDKKGSSDWSWKAAHSTSDAYNFLNGLGSYGEPVDDAKIFAVDDSSFYIFYRKTGTTVSGGTVPAPVVEPDDPAVVPTTPSWSWKKATTVDDAHNFINGLGAYSEPHAVQSIAAADDTFYLFYRDDLEGANEWGWKLAGSEEDAHDFLNKTGAYSGEPKDKAELAYFDDSLYVFYSGTDSSANWGWKRATDIDDMYDYINGAGSYDEPVFGTMGGDTLSDILMFYRDDKKGSSDWSWKAAHSTSDAYNFLNGLGSYGEPVTEAKIFAVDGPSFYIFYRK